MRLIDIDLFAPADGVTLPNMPNEYRQLMAPYANMAVSNIHDTLLYISDKAGIAEAPENRQNSQSVGHLNIIHLNELGYIHPEEQVRISKYFAEHFRMLKPIIVTYRSNRSLGDPTEDEISNMDFENVFTKIKTLKKFFYLVNGIRNMCSHSDAKWRASANTSFSSEREGFLYSCQSFSNSFKEGLYEGGKRILKNRFNYSEFEMNDLNRFKKEGKKFVENPNFKYKLFTSNGMLSGIGMALLVALFLKKDQAFRLFDKLQSRFGQDSGLTDSFQKVKELFCIFRISLPKVKLRSEMPDTAFALDMLNELHKCPDELYNVLSPSKQNKFRVNTEEGDDSNILMKRFEDRFPYFVLRYFDTQRLFRDIRFQVALGKYRFKFYDKKCVDNSNENRVRVLQKELNGFGRLDEIEKIRKDHWNGLIREYEEVHVDTANEQPYITDQKASYVFYQGKVGLLYPTSYNRNELAGLDNIHQNYLPRINADKARCMTPVCWLSIYDLPAMVFHNLLGLNTEATIKKSVDSYYHLFTDISEGKLAPVFTEEDLSNDLQTNYGISMNCIPINMKNYLLGTGKNLQEAISKRIEQRILQYKRSTEHMLKDFLMDEERQKDKKLNRFGKDNFVEIKAGRLASILAADIVNLVQTNKENSNKPTGMNYSVMQANLATFDNKEQLDGMKRMFVSLGFLSGQYAHPFLSKVLDKNPKDVKQLYKLYLEDKHRFFDSLHLKFAKGELGSLKDLSFIMKGNKWIEKDQQFYKDLAKRYLAKDDAGIVKQITIDLPRGLFDAEIREKLQSAYSYIDDLSAALGVEKGNTAMLITSFHKTYLEDDNQEYYEYPRSYKLIDWLKSYDKPKEHFTDTDELSELLKDHSIRGKVFKKIKEQNPQKEDDAIQSKVNRLRNEFQDTEKRIRRYKVQDFLILEMAKRILIGEEANASDSPWHELKLREIGPDNPHVLDRMVDFSYVLYSYGREPKTISVKNHKLKNLPKLYRMNYDNRMAKLLDLIRDPMVSADNLVAELNRYDLNQEDIFSFISKIEFMSPNSSISNFNQLVKSINDNHQILDSEMEENLIDIRNNFCHNSYPCQDQCNGSEAKFAESLKNNTELPNISDEMLNKFKVLTEYFNSKS